AGASGDHQAGFGRRRAWLRPLAPAGHGHHPVAGRAV
ncbi:MAG: hypothetical protein AVDCRST_MAG83-529, partial [uncultured Arthrobacter sp.]